MLNLRSIKPLNPACYRSCLKHPKREKFFSRLDEENLLSLIEYTTRIPFKQKVRIQLGKCKSLVVNMLTSHSGGGQAGISESDAYNHKLSFIIDTPQITDVCFRSKSAGWKNYEMEIRVKQKS